MKKNLIIVCSLLLAPGLGCSGQWGAIITTANATAKKTFAEWLGEENVKRNELAQTLKKMKEKSVDLEKQQAQSEVRLGLIDGEIEELRKRSAEETAFLEKLRSKTSSGDDIEIGGKKYDATKLAKLADQKELEIRKTDIRIQTAEKRKSVMEKMVVALPVIRQNHEKVVRDLDLKLFEIDQVLQLLEQKEEAVKLASMAEGGDLDEDTRRLVEDVETLVGGADQLANEKLDEITNSAELAELEAALKAEI